MSADTKQKPETDVLGTVISLMMAFTIALAFRGFVLEGFVIPTGSMGPTLMGAHVRLFSPVTGYEYPTDVSPAIMDAQQQPNRPMAVMDPMLSQRVPLAVVPAMAVAQQARAGDRVLVLKPLFLVSDPQRWDVVVFKNPTDPVGDTQNYIKRMVGLPNESFLLVDGDVFTGALGAATDALKVARKPEHVQRAVWQPVYDSDYQPIVERRELETRMQAKWDGAPWQAQGDSAAKWTLQPSRTWRFEGSGRSELAWNSPAWPIDDWNAYNALRLAAEASRVGLRAMADPGWRNDRQFPVSDVRLAATIECADLAHFGTTFALTARSNVFRFTVSGADRSVAVERTGRESGEVLGQAKAAYAPRTDGLLSLEFWHVDQQLWVFVDGSLALQMPYDFPTLGDRVRGSMFGRTVEQYAQRSSDPRLPTPPALAWSFDSAQPFTLRRVAVDRDLYYRPVEHDANNQFSVNGDYLYGHGFATDYAHPAQVRADEFVMLGDNSGASRDARLWGRSHELTRRMVGDEHAQPGVVPRELIVGKAWAVYFPAPLPLPAAMGGAAVVPDAGRLRFIR